MALHTLNGACQQRMRKKITRKVDESGGQRPGKDGTCVEESEALLTKYSLDVVCVTDCIHLGAAG